MLVRHKRRKLLRRQTVRCRRSGLPHASLEKFQSLKLRRLVNVQNRCAHWEQRNNHEQRNGQMISCKFFNYYETRNMSTQLHLSTALMNWTKTGHSQVELANLTGLTPASVSRMFKGEQHPDVDTLAQIVSGLQIEYPQHARDIVESYLLDHIPDATAPDGRPWSSLVKIIVEEITTRLAEGQPIPEIVLAKLWFQARTATPEGQRWLLTLYRWANKPAKY